MKGQGQQAADDFKAAQQERAATYGRLKAQQTDAQMIEQTNTQLGNIDAIRAAAGADPTSPTSYALKDRTAALSNRNRSITVDNILAQAASDEADANYMRQAGDYALTSSFVNAGMDIGKGLAKGG
jgi:phage I-like protein